MQIISLRSFAAAAVTCALAAAVSASPAFAASVGGGRTTLTLNGGMAKVLKKAGVSVSASAPATSSGRRLRFEVSSGTVNFRTARGTLRHSGSFTLRSAKRDTLLRGITVTSREIAVNIGDTNGVPLATLDRRSAKPRRARDRSRVKASRIRARLSSEGASELNRRLGVRVFRRGQSLWTVSLDVERSMKIVGGSATLTFDPVFNGTLAATSFKLSGASPASGDNVTSFTFPVTGGNVGSVRLDGEVKVGGGITVDQDGPFITLRDPIANTRGSRSTLTIVAGPFGRVSVGDIDLTRAKITRKLTTRGGTITLRKVPIRFNGLAATALTLVGIPTTEGQLLGTSEVTLRVRPSSGA